EGGAYAAACAFQDAFSQYLSHKHPDRIYCFAWSMWDETGMSRGSPAKKLFRASGYHIIPPDAGAHSLLAGMACPGVLLVGLDGGSRHLRRHIETNPYETDGLLACFAGDGKHTQKLHGLVVRDRFGVQSRCDFFPVREMPLTDTGIPDREKLVSLARAGQHGAGEQVAPRTETERLIAGIWQEVLGISRMGVYDDFFKSGGHSLLATQVISRIEETFHTAFSIQSLFKAPTIAALAEMLAKHETGPEQVEPLVELHAKLDKMSPDEIEAMLLMKEDALCRETEQALDEHPAVGKTLVLPTENEFTAYFTRATKKQVELWPSIAEFFVYDEVLYHTMSTHAFRNRCYSSAFQQVLKGKKVVEIGPGSEVILSRLALEAGAEKIYAIELLEETCRQARNTIKSLGLEERIILIHGDALQTELPEKVDYCISEIVGGIGGSEGAARIINDAKRFLHDGRCMIPRRSLTKIAAITLPQSDFDYSFTETAGHYVEKIFAQTGCKFDLRLCVKNLPRQNIISTADVFEDLDYSGESPLETVHEIVLTFEKEALFNGFLVWLQLYTDQRRMMDILEEPDSWLPVFFPVFEPGIAVSKGDAVRAAVSRKLCENGVNPDYLVEGRIIHKNGGEVKFRCEAPHLNRIYKGSPFYARLFAGDAVPIQSDTSPSPAALRAWLNSRGCAVPSHFSELKSSFLAADGTIDRQALSVPDAAAERTFFQKKKRLLALLREEKGIAVSKAEAEAETITPLKRTGDLPLSFAQQRLWVIEQLAPGNPAYNGTEAMRLIGSLKTAALERVFNEILRRHEVLRTGFSIVNGKAVQVVVPNITLRLPIVDLQHLPAAEQPAKVLRLAREEAQRPFDLAKAPLLRATLLLLAPQEHVLLISMHHIVTDGWSTGVIIREITALYEAYAAGAPSPLPELPVQYADFAVWQRGLLNGERLKAQRIYWKRQLAELPELNLPSARPRPPRPSFRGARHTLRLSAPLTAALHELSLQSEATLFMTLLAGFAVLLCRYSNQEDVAIGIPIANRCRKEIEPLIGFFVNSLVLRADLSENPAFRELLARIRETTINAYANQDFPFEALVEELQPERNLGQNPLVQVAFALQNVPLPTLKLRELRISPLEFDRGTVRLDLEFQLWEAEGELKGYIDYSTDLFDAGTVARMAEHFRNLLEGAAADPD
ncbi:MAG: hypothetical protein GY862_07730, partial [Gammaproteobacteria bacterium]|nr:hypothetical protein [Gammaproteobacteria bacterium]